MSAIWLPGAGMVDLRVTRLDRAAKDYDERLAVGRNEQNGRWAVFIRTARGTFPPLDLYPVLDLGLDVERLPHPDDLQKRLYESDTRRHGARILERMNRENEAIKKEHARIADDATYQAAEALVWAGRRLENDISRRHVRVFPGEKRAGRVTPEAK